MFCFKKFAIFALAISVITNVFITSSAQAGDLDEMSGETFGNSAAVDDAELAEMRGGFINVNGMLIGFNFYSNVQVGLDTLQNVSVNTENLAQAALTASQIQELLQPQIIQNLDDNMLISIQQSLSVDIINSAIMNQSAQVEQLQYLQGMN
ncbi:MAG: hypothetical protein ACK502_07415 [Alphaproteobacteria bacterium]